MAIPIDGSTFDALLGESCRAGDEEVRRLVHLNLGTPTFNRVPDESSGTFGLESAIDELAAKLAMDPIELRLKHYAERNPEDGRPWSSRSLRQCYATGAERFGWKRRTTAPRSMRDGNTLVGFGMSTATYPAKRLPASALARLAADGTIVVQPCSMRQASASAICRSHWTHC